MVATVQGKPVQREGRWVDLDDYLLDSDRQYIEIPDTEDEEPGQMGSIFVDKKGLLWMGR